MAAEVNGSLSDLEEKIIQQVEFYFGDINLPRDKFLMEQRKLDDGWVPLETMIKFNRLKKLATDCNLIADALKRSSTGLIEVSEDKTKIRRALTNPLPENSLEYWQEVKSRTVYAKRFPQDTTLDELQEFFGQFGDVKHISMRRTKGDERLFKGSVFVTYGSRGECDKCVAEAKKFKETDLEECVLQEKYWLRKKLETKQAKKAAKAKKEPEKPKPKYPSGMVLHISGITNQEATTQNVRDYFEQFNSVAWVDLQTDTSEAWIRFHGEENGASVAWEKAKEGGDSEKAPFKVSELNARVLEGEEERKFMENSFKKIEDSRQKKKQAQQQARKQGKKGRDRRAQKASKRTVFKDDEDEAEPSTKSAKVDEQGDSFKTLVEAAVNQCKESEQKNSETKDADQETETSTE